MSTFLSPEVIEEIKKESSSRYINPSKITGEIRVRFVGTGVTGFEAWTKDNKPVRWEQKPDQLPANIRQKEGWQPLKRFVAALVYEYLNNDYKILMITQTTLIEQLFKYMSDDDYGNPSKYDIKISKTGEGKDTKYNLIASPPKEVKADIKKKYEDMYCNLHHLFDGGDPFTAPSA